jgi:hypothetical protein
MLPILCGQGWPWYFYSNQGNKAMHVHALILIIEGGSKGSVPGAAGTRILDRTKSSDLHLPDTASSGLESMRIWQSVRSCWPAA